MTPVSREPQREKLRAGGPVPRPGAGIVVPRSLAWLVRIGGGVVTIWLFEADGTLLVLPHGSLEPSWRSSGSSRFGARDAGPSMLGVAAPLHTAARGADVDRPPQSASSA